jgi:hypothetical protein
LNKQRKSFLFLKQKLKWLGEWRKRMETQQNEKANTENIIAILDLREI